MDEDAMAEQMAEDVYAAMVPLREWYNKLKGHFVRFEGDGFDQVDIDFEKAHEDTEVLLMKLLDKYYGGGFKDGAADERYTREMAEIYDVGE